MTFEHALARVREAASRRPRDVENLALARAHGRVLAGPLERPSHGPGLPVGCVMTPLRVAVAARSGAGTVAVARRPTVAVFAIGEALEPGMPARAGLAHDGARDLLVGLLRADGLEPTAWPRLPAEPRQVEIALRDAGCAFDSILVCGPGRALRQVGEVLAAFGTLDVPAATDAAAPDSPVFGTLDQACVLALPAAPVPLLGLYLTLGRCLLDGLEGRTEARPAWRARTGAAFEGTTFQLVRTVPQADGLPHVLPLGTDNLDASALEASALIFLPAPGDRLEAGVAVDVLPLPMP